jgi:hypothetical protein
MGWGRRSRPNGCRGVDSFDFDGQKTVPHHSPVFRIL